MPTISEIYGNDFATRYSGGGDTTAASAPWKRDAQGNIVGTQWPEPKVPDPVDPDASLLSKLKTRYENIKGLAPEPPSVTDPVEGFKQLAGIGTESAAALTNLATGTIGTVAGLANAAPAALGVLSTEIGDVMTGTRGEQPRVGMDFLREEYVEPVAGALSTNLGGPLAQEIGGVVQDVTETLLTPAHQAGQSMRELTGSDALGWGAQTMGEILTFEALGAGAKTGKKRITKTGKQIKEALTPEGPAEARVQDAHDFLTAAIADAKKDPNFVLPEGAPTGGIDLSAGRLSGQTQSQFNPMQRVLSQMEGRTPLARADASVVPSTVPVEYTPRPVQGPTQQMFQQTPTGGIDITRGRLSEQQMSRLPEAPPPAAPRPSAALQQTLGEMGQPLRREQAAPTRTADYLGERALEQAADIRRFEERAPLPEGVVEPPTPNVQDLLNRRAVEALRRRDRGRQVDEPISELGEGVSTGPGGAGTPTGYSFKDAPLKEKFEIVNNRIAELLDMGPSQAGHIDPAMINELGKLVNEAKKNGVDALKILRDAKIPEHMIKLMLDPKPEEKPADIVHKRQWQAKDGTTVSAPAITAHEAGLLKSSTDMSTRNAFLTPTVFMADKAGPWFKEMLFEPYLDMRKQGIQGKENLAKAIRQKQKEYSVNEQRRVLHKAIEDQLGGELLDKSGIARPGELTPKETQLRQWLDSQYKSYLDRLNEVRVSNGHEPIPATENYMPIFRDLEILREKGIAPEGLTLDQLQDHAWAVRDVPFAFAKKRVSGADIPVDASLGALQALYRYGSASEHSIAMTPIIAKGKEILQHFETPEMKGRNFASLRPNSSHNVANWLNTISTGRVSSEGMPRWTARMLMGANKNLGSAILGAYVSTALKQPSAIKNVALEIGPKYALKGLDALRPEKLREIKEKSREIAVRNPDATISDMTTIAENNIASGIIGNAAALRDQARNVSNIPLKYLDGMTAAVAFEGSYKYAKEKLRMDERRAIEYADNVVIKTQGSGDIGLVSPIQRHVAGRLLSLFQTFAINEFNYLTRDVMGVGNKSVSLKDAITKTGQFALATALTNTIYEDVLNMNSPSGTPLRSIMHSISEDESPGKTLWDATTEMANYVPFLGGAAYGQGPGGVLLNKIGDLFAGMQGTMSSKELPKTAYTQSLPALLDIVVGLPGSGQVQTIMRGLDDPNRKGLKVIIPPSKYHRGEQTSGVPAPRGRRQRRTR